MSKNETGAATPGSAAMDAALAEPQAVPPTARTSYDEGYDQGYRVLCDWLLANGEQNDDFWRGFVDGVMENVGHSQG